jgi:integrase
MYHCGLRLGEACRIEVTHLDRKRGVLRVINGSRGPREGLRQTASNEQPCCEA